jgi:hypothetical protein
MIAGEVVNVLDFGAKGDGVTNDQPAVQAALTYLFASGKNTLYFPDGNFYFATPLTVTFTTGRSLRIIGTSCAGMTSGNTPPGGTRLFGADGIESIILLTNAVLSSPVFYAFECSNINFFQPTSIIGAVCAIKNLVGNGPNRPFIVKNCNFFGFDKALSSDLTQAQALDPAISTGSCVANITQNSFYGNGYALYGKGLGAWMNLNFVSNNCEQNGSGGLFTEDLGIAAGCNISDNLLEGQPNAVNLSCGLAMVNIERNYFEGNTSDLVAVACSNPGSHVKCVNNYNITSATAARFSGCVLQCDETIPTPIVNNIYGKSNLGVVTRYGASEATNQITLDVNSISKLTSVTPFNVVGMDYSVVSATTELTPIGTVNVENVSTAGTIHSFTGSIATNGYVVFQALVRKVAGSIVYIALYDNALSGIGNSDTSYTLASQKGDWLYIQIVIKATGPSTGTFNYRWVSNSTIDVTDTFVYVIPAQSTIGETMLCLPNP